MAKIFHPFQLFKSLKFHRTYQKIQFRKSTLFFKDKVIELKEKTLTGRLLTYLNQCNTQVNENIPKAEPIDIKMNDFKTSDIQQIKTCVKLLDISQDINNFYLFEDIDKECSNRVEHLKTSIIFELLHIYMTKVPNRIINYKFYESAIHELKRRLKFLNKNEIVQLVFYIGLKKKISKEHEIVRKCVNRLLKLNDGSLTAEDLCIICNSTFKTTTRINTEQLFSTIITYLYNNLKLFKDPALLITLLKTIRQNRYQDEDLLITMTYTMFFNKTIDYYSFSALGHILAVYSDYLYYDENILNLFSDRCVRLLKESEFISKRDPSPTHIRLKDIKRFLWCLSNLNYKLEIDDIKTVIIPNIVKRVENGDIEHDYSSLVEISLYLWMLNYRAYELLPYFLTEDNIRHINTLTTPLKQRLNLLLFCIMCEDKELLKDHKIKLAFLEYDMTRQLAKRDCLQNVMNHLVNNFTDHEISKFEMKCQVPVINIIGITGYKKEMQKVVHIEVLDEYTVLKNTENLPTGLMQLKLRLLDQMDQAVILIESEELEALSDKEIQELLLEEIEFVC